MDEPSLEAILSRYNCAKSRRLPWESLWRDCYAFALPQRGSGLGAQFDPARRHAEELFDGTAPDAVDQLAASLLAELTPPWSEWFGLVPGAEVDEFEVPLVADGLDRATATIQGHFDRSNTVISPSRHPEAVVGC